MKKDKLLLVGLLVIILTFGIIITIKAFKKEEAVLEKTDAIKIKEEYSKLNGEVNKDNLLYPVVTLSDDNPFVKSSEEKVIDILENKTGIIYFGYASDAYARTLIPVLESVCMDEDVLKVYYLDIENIRDEMDLDNNGKPIVKEQGTKSYYKLLELLDDYLDEYILIDKDGDFVKTNEKRLTSPTVVAVEDGVVKKVHIGTVKTQKTGYDELSVQESKELKSSLSLLVNSIESANVCTKEAC